jgi:hypothetical protein
MTMSAGRGWLAAIGLLCAPALVFAVGNLLLRLVDVVHLPAPLDSLAPLVILLGVVLGLLSPLLTLAAVVVAILGGVRGKLGVGGGLVASGLILAAIVCDIFMVLVVASWKWH